MAVSVTVTVTVTETVSSTARPHVVDGFGVGISKLNGLGMEATYVF